MKTSINTNELAFQTTAHGAGEKKVMIQSSDTSTSLTQFAYGKLSPEDKIPLHAHNTMEEVFYFLHGEGVYTLDGEAINVFPGIVIRIPAGVPHFLVTTGTAALEFIYFGIATE